MLTFLLIGQCPSAMLLCWDRHILQIFKLSQGEYVAIEKVESVYNQLDLLAQVWVYGNSMESSLVAVGAPEPSVFLDAAKKKGLTGSLQEVIAKPETKQMVLEEMDKIAKQHKLKVRIAGVFRDNKHSHRLWSLCCWLLRLSIRSQISEAVLVSALNKVCPSNMSHLYLSWPSFYRVLRWYVLSYWMTSNFLWKMTSWLPPSSWSVLSFRWITCTRYLHGTQSKSHWFCLYTDIKW